MNIFTRFVVVAFTLLFSAQALANFLVGQASLVRVNKNTLKINYNDTRVDITSREMKVKIFANDKYYAGSATTWSLPEERVLLPNSSGSSLTSWIDPALVELDKDKVETALISVKLYAAYNVGLGDNDVYMPIEKPSFTRSISLDYNIPLVLVNTALDIEEGSGKYAILESNQLNTTFAIVREDNSHLFEIVNGNQLKFRSVPDYETITQKTYQLKIKMTKPNLDDVITDITIKLKNIHDIDPNDLTFSVSNTSFIEKRADGVYYIKENIPVNTTIGSITIIERDEATPPGYVNFQVINSHENSRLEPGNKFLVSNALDYESRTTGYETIVVYNNRANKVFFRKFFNYKIVNVHEKTINIANQVRSVSENAEIGASVGAVITATGDTTITSYSIVSGNNEGIFSIDNNGQITINDNSKLDYETTQTYFINVKVSGEDADDKTAKITINIDNITENIIVINDQQMEILKASDIGVVVGTIVPSSGTVNTWSITDGVDSNYYQINDNGVISVKAKLANSITTHNITVQADGEDANTTTATITIKATTNAHPPQINNTDVAVDEGTIQVLTITASDADLVEKNQALSYGISGSDVSAFTLNNQVISFNAAPDYEIKNSYNLVLKVSDGISETQKNIIVTINNIHEKTINISAQTRTIDENSVSGDNIGDKLVTTGVVKSFSIIEGNSENLFRIDNSGQIKVSNTGLDYESAKTYALTVKITGEDADDKTAVISVNVNNVNEKTININNQSRSVVENSIINTPVGDKIATTGTIASFEIIEGNTNDMFTVDSTGQIKVAKLGLDYEVLSTYSLKVKITGKEADEKIAIVTVRIKNVLENTIGLNANQVFYSQGKSSGVDIGTIATSASINTVDQFTILEGNTDGLFFVSPSGIIYLLKKAPTARDYDLKIEIKASDAAPVVGSIQIRISNTNPLIINNNDITRNEGTSLTALTISVSNNVGALIYSISGEDKDRFSVDDNTGVVVFKTAPDYEIPVDGNSDGRNTYNITIIIKDGDLTVNKPIKITINNVNDANLTISDQNMDINENSAVDTVVGTLVTTGIVRTFEIVSGNTNDIFAVSNTGQITVAKALDFETTASYTLGVKITGVDADDKQATITINIGNILENIIGLNDQPMHVLKGSNAGVSVGTVVLSSGSAAVSTWEITKGKDTSKYSIDNSGVIKTATAIADTVTNHTITVKAIGVDAAPVTATITISVTANPNPPSISNTNVVRDEGSALTALTITATDATTPAQTLTYNIGGTDAALFTINDTVVTFKTAPDYEAPADNGGNNVYDLVLEVNDGISTSGRAISITIDNVLESTLTITNQSRDITENPVVNANVGDVLATTGTPTGYSITAGNDAGLFKINNSGQIQVAKAGLDFEKIKKYTLTVQITKTDAANKTAAITINIINIPDTAIEQDPTVSIDKILTTAKVTLIATGIDPDGNSALSYAWTQTDATGMSISLTGAATNIASFVTTEAMYGKTYTFKVVVTDNDNRTGEKTVEVSVIRELAITTIDVSTPENIDKMITLATNRSGASFEITGGADVDHFTLNGSTLTFKATDFEARSDVTYSVAIKATKDNEMANKTITVTVTDINEAPTVTISGGGKFSINKSVSLKANVNDPEKSATLTYAWKKDNAVLTGKSNSTLNFTTTEAMKGKTFTYEVSVSDGTTSVKATATVSVNNAKAIAQAVRKESKVASKALLSKVRKTVMGRLSHLRQKNKQKSAFNAHSFVNGIQVSFADSKTNSLINHVLSANGLSNVIKTPSRKIERWDTWTSAKIVIGKSNGDGDNKTEFNFKSLNLGIDRRIAKDKIIGFTLGLGREYRSAIGDDFSGDIDTTQYTLSSYGSLELNKQTSVEAVFGIAKGTHKFSSTDFTSADPDSEGLFASVAYRADTQIKGIDLSPFIRYDISRIKMKANDVLTNSETTTDRAFAIGIDISKQVVYQDGQLNRFISVEYKSDLSRDNTNYISENAEQEVSVKLGMDYLKNDTTISVNYERVQSTNNKAHSDGVEGTLSWKF